MAIKGIGLKIKFTRHADSVRNKANIPDQWEVAIIKKVQQQPRIYYEANATLNGNPAYRQFTPLPIKPYCLNCHGSIADNPLNKDKSEHQWTDIDMTGFKMENWKLGDFGGGVSISLDKTVLENGFMQ